MRNSIRKAMRHDDSGFTLIELLVVMIIIGVLAGIAIPVFLSQQDRAKDTALKSDVSTVAKEISTYYVDGEAGLTPAVINNGTQLTLTSPETPPLFTQTIELSRTGTALAGNSVVTNSSTWCVGLTQNDTGNTWRYSSTGGLEEGACP